MSFSLFPQEFFLEKNKQQSPLQVLDEGQHFQFPGQLFFLLWSKEENPSKYAKMKIKKNMSLINTVSL